MGADIDVFGVLQQDFTRPVQEEADALGVGGVGVSCTVMHGKFPILIIPKLKLEAFRLGPTRQARGVTEAHAYNLYVQCLELFVEVAVPATFNRSTIC